MALKISIYKSKMYTFFAKHKKMDTFFDENPEFDNSGTNEGTNDYGSFISIKESNWLRFWRIRN